MPEQSFPTGKQMVAYGAHRRWAATCIVLAAASFAGAWLVSTQPPEIRSSVENILRLLATPKVLLSVVLGSAILGFWVWSFLTLHPRAARVRDFHAALRREGRLLAVVFAGFTLALMVLGFLFVRDLEKAFRSERLSQQAGIAQLKAQQVDKWLFERMLDTKLLASSLRSLPADRLAAGWEARQIIELLIGEFLAGSAERISVSLLSPDGKVLGHAGAGTAPDERTTMEALAAASATPPEFRIVDVHLDNASQPRMGFVGPIQAGNAGGSTIAILVVVFDPSRLLLPDVQSWPNAGPTSEVLLTTRRGNEIIYITPPRFVASKPGPLAFRTPVPAASQPPQAATAVTGDEVGVGPDYRGVIVLTASHRVAGVPWVATAQTDSEEVDAPLDRKVTTVVLVVAAIVFVAAAMFLVQWANQRATFETFRDQQEEERAALVKHFSELVQLSRDIVLLRDDDGNIIDANEAAVKAYLYSHEELRKLNFRDLCESDSRPVAERRHAEQIHRRKDGTLFPVEITGRALDVDGKRYRQSFIRDITHRKQLEQEAARLSRVKQALLTATSGLLRAKTEIDIYGQVCRVLVESSNYQLAAIAAPDRDAVGTVRFLAIAGLDDGLTAQARAAWGGGPMAQEPTGHAIVTGEISVNRNLRDGAESAPWRDEALARGIQSSIALPLRAGGKTFASLVLYAEQLDIFDKEEVALLSILADDVSYAVSALAERAGVHVA